MKILFSNLQPDNLDLNEVIRIKKVIDSIPIDRQKFLDKDKKLISYKLLHNDLDFNTVTYFSVISGQTISDKSMYLEATISDNGDQMEEKVFRKFNHVTREVEQGIQLLFDSYPEIKLAMLNAISLTLINKYCEIQ